MKLFHTHGLRQNKGTFGCGHTALKCRAKKLLQRIVTGCGYLFQKAIGFAPSAFTRKFRKQTREAVNGRDVTRDGIRKRHCTFEIGHAFVRLRHVFGFVFGNFLTGSPFCRKNRKIAHKSRLKAFIRRMDFFSRETVGIFCFWQQHRTDLGASRRQIQLKKRIRSGYGFTYFNRPSYSRYSLMHLRPHFERYSVLNTHSRRGFISFRENLQCLCGTQSAGNGRTCALLRGKTALCIVLSFFAAFSRFGAPVASAVGNSKEPSQIVGATKKDNSVNHPLHSTNSSKPPAPPAGSSGVLPVRPSVPADTFPASPAGTPSVMSDPSKPSAEPKEIKELKSYCESNPDDWAGFYNLGIEQYKLMDYNAAQQSFSQALQNCSDPKEQEKIFYNLGNAGFRFSQSQSVDQQVLGFKESLQNYENALAIDKEAKDTQHNIEVVKRYLKRAEKQQQQEQQNKKDDKKDDNKKLTNMEKDNDASDNKDKDKDKDNDKDKDKDDKDDKDNQKDQQDDSGNKNVDLEQKEMDNILNRAKKVEKMLPPSSLNPQSGGKDPVIRDW